MCNSSWLPTLSPSATHSGPRRSGILRDISWKPARSPTSKQRSTRQSRTAPPRKESIRSVPRRIGSFPLPMPSRETQPSGVFSSHAGHVALIEHTTPNGPVLSSFDAVWGFATPFVGMDATALVLDVADLLTDLDFYALTVSGLDPAGPLFDEVQQLGPAGFTDTADRCVADLGDGFGTWIDRRSPRFRRSLRAAANRAETTGITIDQHSPELREVDAIFARILAIEKTSWKTDAGSGLVDTDLGVFTRAMAERFASSGALRVQFARLDDDDIGYVIGARVGNRYRGFQHSFNQNFPELSIGKLLQFHTIANLASEGVTAYEHGKGDQTIATQGRDRVSQNEFAELHNRLNAVSRIDQKRLGRRVKGARKIKQTSRRSQVLDEISTKIDRAEKQQARRIAAIPNLTYPAELPITQRREQLVRTIRDNQVVVIAGETGSGKKSTQLPKMCLEAGLGRAGLIGHTQPRRIAARSVGARIAEELGQQIGGAVGYSVRFDNRTNDKTTIKVMTDGILLAELAHDPDLLAYDVIIVDEAHERSLNIDFLLGYLHRLVPRRPDLHVVVTSATIDTAKIAAHFDGAPIIEVSGRNFPVDVRYRPLDSEGEKLEVPAAVRRAISELTRVGPGDILVFSNGEREINEICEAVRRHEPDLEVLPLYARLSSKEQQRVFGESKRRRIVVSTNVAETSLTVPGVRFVIDVGQARISRFSQRTKVQRLPIEPISQASANQRSGRCGRLGPGVAIRLYEEDDFEARPEFTEPEIQRTNLASVILTMANQRLGSPLEFPFIDPPDPRAVTDGVRLLHELRAVESPMLPEKGNAGRGWLTNTGKALARFPMDPRLGRIVLAGDEQGCLFESIIIAASLAVQDPRERPREKQKAADDAHAFFVDDRSDILTLLHLWHVASNKRREMNRRQFTKWCRDRFLHAQRMGEWFDTIEQLRAAAEEMGLANSYSSDFDVSLGPGSGDPSNWGDDIHRAVLAGMLSQVGMRIERSHEYLGPRNARFAIQPGSTTFETKPDWVMATTLVETSRLWARTVAPIDPAWLEAPAEHLTSCEVGDAAWDPQSGRAMTTETVRLHGLPIIADRLVPVDGHDPVTAREMFIHHALIEGDWDHQRHGFEATNASVRREARNLAVRATQRSFDDEYDRVWTFYDGALPAHITSGPHFESWFGPAAIEDPHLLEMSVHDLITEEEATVDEAKFPDEISHQSMRLALDYQDAATSVAVDIPVAATSSIDAMTFLGVVPGHRREAIIALLRALPKPLRKRLVPVPETVDRILASLADPASGPGADAAAFALGLRQAVERRIGEPLPFDALDPRSLPQPLRPHYRIVNDDGDVLAEGGDLDVLRSHLQADIEQALHDGSEGVSHPGAVTWEFGTIPKTVSVGARQGATTAYPALIDRIETVGVDLLPSASAQSAAMWSGARRLLRLTVKAPLREMNQVLTNARLLSLTLTAHGERKEWFEDLTLACLGTIIDDAGIPWDGDDFAQLQDRARRDLPRLATEWAPVAADMIDETAAIRMAIVSGDHLPQDCVHDARNHLDRLVFPGHLNAIGVVKFHDMVRYLRGIRERLDKLPTRILADRTSMHEILGVEDFYDTVARHMAWSKEIESVAWSLEELRISAFAQQLGAREKVSAKRIRRRLDKIAAT
nr:ATP-dependent RNA helicase HrpA-like [Nerophis lumbriciformis]